MPGVQPSMTDPPAQEVEPVASQAPMPQVVASETESSSAAPSPSSSIPLQLESSGADVPGSQLSSTCPALQLVEPSAAQPPVPHDVVSAAKSSSTAPSQSSSIPSRPSPSPPPPQH